MKTYLKNRKNLMKTAAVLVLAVLGLLDGTGVIRLGTFHGSLAIIGAAAVMLAAAYAVLLKRTSRTLKFFCRMVVISAVLELTVFQLPSYNMLFGDYEKKTIYPTEMAVSGGINYIDDANKTVSVVGQQQVSLTLDSLGIPVKTVSVDCDYNGSTKRLNLYMDVSDETHVEPRADVASAVIVKGSESSKFAACQFSGDVSKIIFKFSCFNDADAVIIKSIHLNEAIPFDISALRFIFMTFIITLCYGIAVSGFLKKPFRLERRFTRFSIFALTALAVSIATTMVMVKLPEEGFASRWKLGSGDQITQEIVDAFENHQVNLLFEPSEELKAMENPYDWGERNAVGAYYEWDHVYYDGKYYSYYGVGPVLTVFLPYHMITGHYFASDMAVWIFSCLGIIFLGMTYIQIVRRWLKTAPVGCIIGGYIILIASCGIWFSVGRTQFYEIAVSSGFMFLNMAAYFLISANILSNGKKSLVRTALCSLCLGLAVLSRPTLAVYAVCVVIFWLMSLKKTAGGRKFKIAYAITSILPIGILGAFQLWYNYARFDSPFDFGIQYSLTINDFVHSQFHIIFVIIVAYNFLFAPPAFSTDYPYITTNYGNFNANGFWFQDAGNTSGILFLALPVFSYLLSGQALRALPDSRSRVRSSIMIGLPCVVMPFVIVCSAWESGYAVRYMADFAWEIVIGALLVLFFVYRKSQNILKRYMIRVFMAVSTAISIVINAVQIVPFAFYENDYPEIGRRMQDIIAFWS